MKMKISQVIEELKKLQEKHGDKFFLIHDHLADFDEPIAVNFGCNEEVTEEDIIIYC